MRFDLANGKLLGSRPLTLCGQMWPFGNNLALSPRHGHLAVGQQDDHGRILDPASSKELQRLVFANRTEEKKIPGLTALTFSPDGGFLAAADWDGWLHWWDVAKRRVVWELQTRKYGLSVLAVSPDGRWLAGASDEGLVRLWATSNGKEAVALEAPQSSAWQVLIGPDGRSVVCANHDGNVRHWDLATAKLLLAIAFEDRFPGLDIEPASGNFYLAHGKRFDRWNLERNLF